MWLCEDKLKGKTAHFRLPSASQKRACLSSLSKDDDDGYWSVKKSIISRYCNNLAMTRSRLAWKICINIPERTRINGVDAWREN